MNEFVKFNNTEKLFNIKKDFDDIVSKIRMNEEERDILKGSFDELFDLTTKLINEKQ